MMRKAMFLAAAMFVMAFCPQTVSAKKAATEPALAVFTLSPKMTCSNCENKIKSNIRFEKGVKEIITDLKGQTVSIKYDPAKTDKVKLETAFKKIGYTASEVKATEDTQK